MVICKLLSFTVSSWGIHQHLPAITGGRSIRTKKTMVGNSMMALMKASSKGSA